MNNDVIKTAQKDIDEALKALENIENTLDNKDSSKDHIKENFLFLTNKMEQIEKLLKKEGIL